MTASSTTHPSSATRARTTESGARKPPPPLRRPLPASAPALRRGRRPDLVAHATKCSPVALSRGLRFGGEARERLDAAGAVHERASALLDFELDGRLVADTANPEALRSLVEAQLLFTVGQLNGGQSVGRLGQLEVSANQRDADPSTSTAAAAAPPPPDSRRTARSRAGAAPARRCSALSRSCEAHLPARHPIPRPRPRPPSPARRFRPRRVRGDLPREAPRGMGRSDEADGLHLHLAREVGRRINKNSRRSTARRASIPSAGDVDAGTCFSPIVPAAGMRTRRRRRRELRGHRDGLRENTHGKYPRVSPPVGRQRLKSWRCSATSTRPRRPATRVCTRTTTSCGARTSTSATCSPTTPATSRPGSALGLRRDDVRLGAELPDGRTIAIDVMLVGHALGRRGRFDGWYDARTPRPTSSSTTGTPDSAQTSGPS